jgi:hypothetical protein
MRYVGENVFLIEYLSTLFFSETPSNSATTVRPNAHNPSPRLGEFSFWCVADKVPACGRRSV